MTRSAHERLRLATRADHDRLESRVDVLARAASPDARRQIVSGFYRLHAEAEAALAPWLERMPGLDFEARRRTLRLTADLAALGEDAPSPGVAPRVSSACEALGRMYVLEGSSLGGRVIRRALETRGQGMTGLSFLDPYGSQTGERWRSFLAILEREGRGPADVERMVAGAIAGFRHAEHTLCGEPIDG